MSIHAHAKQLASLSFAAGFAVSWAESVGVVCCRSRANSSDKERTPDRKTLFNREMFCTMYKRFLFALCLSRTSCRLIYFHVPSLRKSQNSYRMMQASSLLMPSHFLTTPWVLPKRSGSTLESVWLDSSLLKPDCQRPKGRLSRDRRYLDSKRIITAKGWERNCQR
jgi:hypothetical protein